MKTPKEEFLIDLFDSVKEVLERHTDYWIKGSPNMPTSTINEMVKSVDNVLNPPCPSDDDCLFEELRDQVDEINAKWQPHSSLHETYGIIHEETLEFVDEMRKKEGSRIGDSVKKELMDIAAAAIRGIQAFEAQQQQNEQDS